MTATQHRAPSRARPLLSPVLFTVRTKGVSGLAYRVRTAASRFGPTPQRIVEQLTHMVRVADAGGLLPTLPITAVVLDRHPHHIRELAQAGVEFPIHGLYHNDHLTESSAVQRDDVLQAMATFARHGLTAHGFRAPYLRADEATSAAVRNAGLRYESDDAIAFDTLGDHDTPAYGRALEMYRARSALVAPCRPSIDDGLVRIPVCLPDDEMLIDRLHLGEDDVASAWCRILDDTHAAGDIFTMQVHPERFAESATAVSAVLLLAASKRAGVWRTQLRDVADWWLARRACQVRVEPRGEQGMVVTVDGDRRAGIHTVGGGEAPDDHAHRRTLVLPPGPMPAVGITADAPVALQDYLDDEGYLVAPGAQPGSCAVFLPPATDPADHCALRDRIAAATAPVVVRNRWPFAMRSALALTGDIDALTIQDFVHRVRENGRRR